jgi:hypothetical protein
MCCGQQVANLKVRSAPLNGKGGWRVTLVVYSQLFLRYDLRTAKGGIAMKMRDVLAQRASENFVGRTDEMDVLLDTLEKDNPIVVHIHGIGGIGKTSLLDAVTHQARERDVTVVRLDCRSLEPTERGFLRELGAAVLRRTTRSLLAAMLPDAAPQDAYERLLALPFVEHASDGLIVHDAVQQAIATALRAADPNKYRSLQRTA